MFRLRSISALSASMAIMTVMASASPAHAEDTSYTSLVYYDAKKAAPLSIPAHPDTASIFGLLRNEIMAPEPPLGRPIMRSGWNLAPDSSDDDLHEAKISFTIDLDVRSAGYGLFPTLWLPESAQIQFQSIDHDDGRVMIYATARPALRRSRQVGELLAHVDGASTPSRIPCIMIPQSEQRCIYGGMLMQTKDMPALKRFLSYILPARAEHTQAQPPGYIERLGRSVTAFMSER